MKSENVNKPNFNGRRGREKRNVLGLFLATWAVSDAHFSMRYSWGKGRFNKGLSIFGIIFIKDMMDLIAFEMGIVDGCEIRRLRYRLINE